MDERAVAVKPGSFWARPKGRGSDNLVHIPHKVAITGASGLIGRALTRALEARGDEPVPARREAKGQLRWHVPGGFIPADALSGFDAVVHLAGENVAGGRWTAARRAAILQSRVEGTRAVVDAIRSASPRPRVLVSASAVGYYGDPGDRLVDEGDGPGEGFLADVCRQWEAEARAAETLGVRVVRARIGVVLSADGGALTRLMPIFKMGVGGRVGDGQQWMSWVHIADVVGALCSLLARDDVVGPVNIVAPSPVTNREFTRALAKHLRRPALLPVPAVALRLALGEMSSVVLAGQRVAPEALRRLGYEFDYDELDAALHHLVHA